MSIPIRTIPALRRISQTSLHIFKQQQNQSPKSSLSSTTLRTMSSSTSTSSPRPSGLIATTGLELLTFGTPNGHKISILLEELKAAYNTPYTFQSIDITQNIQKEDWFTSICPNGRIPALVDHDRDDFAVFEGAAILSYLVRYYDKEGKFGFDVKEEGDEYSRCEQWVAWQTGGLGPMQGQANHFYRLAKERIPYPTQRYIGETERLYGILDRRLSSGREYLVGPGHGKYSIADIANFSWVNVSYFAGVDLAKFKNLERWWKRIEERPAVRKGLKVPSESRIVNTAYQERMEGEEGFKEQEEKLRALGDEAKERYGYKYASP